MIRVFYPIFFFSLLHIFFSCEKMEKFAADRGKKRLSSGTVEEWHAQVKDLEKQIQSCVVAADRLSVFYRKIGEEHSIRQNFPQASKYYALALEHGASTASFYHDYASVLATQARLEKDSGNIKQSFVLGEQAQQLFRKALLKNAQSLSSQFGLALLKYYVLERKKEGMQQLEMLANTDNKNSRILFALAGIYYLEGNLNRSMVTYQRILQLVPEKSQEAKQANQNIQQILIQQKKG